MMNMEEQVVVETEGMDREEERLKSFLLQFRTEFGILDRMIYKNKNQHRHCFYFQSLLKVRRDIRLLLSMGLEENLKSALLIIHGKNPAQRVYLLERLKERHSGGNYTFQERLLGVARLLAQMTEPILRAAIQITSLLGRSFFMSFSLTILSLLARLRVLAQQMLIDIAKVFNMVSSLSQKKHSVKLIKNGVEVFKEYYPPSREVTLLDCSWEGDKFVLLERASISNTEEHRMDVEAAFLKASDVKYEKVKISDEDHNCADANDCNEEEHTYGGDFARSPPTIGTSSSDAKTLGDRSQSQATKMTAFIPVNVTSETMQGMPKKMKLDDSLISNPVGIKENENSFFDLLTSGIVKSSLFD